VQSINWLRNLFYNTVAVAVFDIISKHEMEKLC